MFNPNITVKATKAIKRVDDLVEGFKQARDDCNLVLGEIKDQIESLNNFSTQVQGTLKVIANVLGE